MQDKQNRKDNLTWGDTIRSMPDRVLIKFLVKCREDSYAPWCPPVCHNNYECDRCQQEWISGNIK